MSEKKQTDKSGKDKAKQPKDLAGCPSPALSDGGTNPCLADGKSKKLAQAEGGNKNA